MRSLTELAPALHALCASVTDAAWSATRANSPQGWLTSRSQHQHLPQGHCSTSRSEPLPGRTRPGLCSHTHTHTHTHTQPYRGRRPPDKRRLRPVVCACKHRTKSRQLKPREAGEAWSQRMARTLYAASSQHKRRRRCHWRAPWCLRGSTLPRGSVPPHAAAGTLSTSAQQQGRRPMLECALCSSKPLVAVCSYWSAVHPYSSVLQATDGVQQAVRMPAHLCFRPRTAWSK